VTVHRTRGVLKNMKNAFSTESLKNVRFPVLSVTKKVLTKVIKALARKSRRTILAHLLSDARSKKLDTLVLISCTTTERFCKIPPPTSITYFVSNRELLPNRITNDNTGVNSGARVKMVVPSRTDAGTVPAWSPFSSAGSNIGKIPEQEVLE